MMNVGMVKKVCSIVEKIKYYWIFLLFLVAVSDVRNSSNFNSFKPIENYFLIKQFFNDEYTTKKYIESLNNISITPNLRSVPKGFDENWILRGPNKIGARVNVIKPDPKNNQIVYLGFSSGGLWKTLDGGQTWNAIFDNFPWLAIADVNIDPINSKIIYVATGDPNISGYPFVGDGVYKSVDGGQTWKNIGPAGTQVISKILINPVNTYILYASSMGLPFQRDKQRGIYKSINGGITWEKIWHVADDTGIIDIILDPFNANVIYAASWPRVRNNRESLLSGVNASIFKSVDGGNSWIKSDNGLKFGPKGRIGLVASKLTPNLLFSIVIGENNEWEGFYKSVNGGTTWVNLLTNKGSNSLPDNAMGGFGWYFGKIEINPKNDQDLFILGVDLWRSKDGGATWFLGAPPWYENNVHADKHDLVFLNETNLLLASDGGVYQSKDNGQSWIDYEEVPATQFYRIASNPHKPDAYYGGAQDHGTLKGENPQNWVRLYGGDGFQQVFDPNNDNIFYTLTQNGNILVTTNKGLSFIAAMNGIDKSEPVAWDAPLIRSSFNANTLYTGTSRVYKNTEGANAYWKAISNDLTDGNIYGARFHNITTIHESTKLSALVYAGTSDANCWRYDPETNIWTNISNGLPQRYITSVQASPTFTDNVYVTLSGYKDNDWQSHIFLSKEKGDKWRSIKGDLPYISINDLVIIPNHSDSLLFIATDAGVYGSINGGLNWHKLGKNLPMVAVYDLHYVPEKMELIAGTFGRSIHTYKLTTLLEKKYSLTVSPTNLSIPSIGGNFSLNIVSNTQWSIYNANSFIRITPTSGVDNSIVSLICEPNNSVLPRTDKMVIKGTGVDSTVVSITQNGILPTFTVSPQNISFTSGNQSQKISIETNTSWKVFKNVDYIKTNVTAGSGNTFIEVTCSINLTANPRTELLKFLPNGMDTILVKITQAGNAVSANKEVSNKYSSFQVFPNPILYDFITLKKTNGLFEESTTVSLYQVNGHLIKSYQVPIFSEELVLRLPQLSKGIYLLVVRNSKNQIIQSEKLVK
jgi:photosystem II stability/assembly factor-like uncharacterized protein